MVKFIVSLFLIAGLVFSALVFMGYEFHLENIKHYLPGTSSGAKSVELVLTDGRTLQGELVKDDPYMIELRLDGGVRRIPKTQIQSSKETESNLFVDFIENAKYQHQVHPLLAKVEKETELSNFNRSTS